MKIRWPPKNVIKFKGEIWEAEENRVEQNNQAKWLPLVAFCSKILTMKKKFLWEKSDNPYNAGCYYQVTITFVS